MAHQKSILVLGGSSFVGRTIVEHLLSSGQYEVTLFNRGITGKGLFPGVRTLTGDRSARNIASISQGNWDVVVDVSCYYPYYLENIFEEFATTPGQYLFISTCSVYDNSNNRSALRTEDSAIHSCDATQAVDTSPSTYGPRKAECERMLQASGFPYLIFRPALVYGPYDPTDRLYYWLWQVRHSRELLLPNGGNSLFSMTYARDLARSVERAIGQETTHGVYSAVSIAQSSIGAVTQAAQNILGTRPEVLSISPDLLREHGVSEWVDMPLWIDGDYGTYDPSRFLSDFGIAPDVETSFRETIAYFDQMGWPKPKYGMSEAKRSELIKLARGW